MIIRSAGPLSCPILMEAMDQQRHRIEEFYDEDLFIISPTKTDRFILILKIGKELIPVQEVFLSVEDVMNRIEFISRTLGIKAEIRYESV
jgi:hypothetical protein